MSTAATDVRLVTQSNFAGFDGECDGFLFASHGSIILFVVWNAIQKAEHFEKKRI